MQMVKIKAGALAVLTELGLSYRLLETEGFDHALRTLRNPTAP